MEAVMDTRREPLIVTALVAGLLGVGAARPVAETDPRPTLAVVSFKGPDIPPETGDAMADELATQFVETGRYRVLHRNWLMAAAGPGNTSVAALREAAAAANIRYLVTGEARYGMSLGGRGRNTLFFDVRVISVATGDVVRTATGRTAATPPRSRRPAVRPMGLSRTPGVLGHMTTAQVLANQASQAPSPAVMARPSGAASFAGPGPAFTSTKAGLPGTAGSLVRAAATAVAAHRAKHRSAQAAPALNGGWQQAIADIARSINLTGESR
jgi:TolB-like protein